MNFNQKLIKKREYGKWLKNDSNILIIKMPKMFKFVYYARDIKISQCKKGFNFLKIYTSIS